MLMEAFNFHDDEDHNSSRVELEMNELVANNNNNNNSSGVPKLLYLVMPAEWLDPTLPLPTDQEFHRWISAQRRRHGRSLGRSSSEASFGSSGSRGGWQQRMVETSTDLLQRARSGIQRSNSHNNNNNTNLAGMFGNRLGDEGVELLPFE